MIKPDKLTMVEIEVPEVESELIMNLLNQTCFQNFEHYKLTVMQGKKKMVEER